MLGWQKRWVQSKALGDLGSGGVMVADPLIELQHVTKNYGRLRVLDDVSLTIGSGITGLLGPNGAGKTTLIKAMLQLVRLQEGSGQVLGYPLGRKARAIRAATGYMPEDDCYLPGLTGVELLQLVARLSGFPAIEGLRRAHEILDFCEVDQERYRLVDTYSTGMRQKLKFAQAIVHDPRFLILDEPTAGLDPEEREGMLARIRSLASRSGKAILISTHILPDVQVTCDHVIIMAAGRVRLSRPLDQLNRPHTPAYQISVTSDATALTQRMEAAGWHVDANGAGELTVTPPDGQSVETVWQWSRQLGIGIRNMTPAQNSLEHIFLQAVGEQDSAHS